MPLIKNQTYTWAQILAATNSVAGPVFYLLHRVGTNLVTAASLDIAKNCRAPYEIWAGDGEKIRDWADILDVQVQPFEVFVTETDGLHYYRGSFERVASTNDPHEIALRGKQANRTNIYKIIFLEEVPAPLSAP